MRIGLYNRYWNTRGGGERYAGVMAEILAQDHDVELLGAEPVDLSGLSDHLGLDISGLSCRVLPPVSERRLGPLTAEYDLFINCTYLSRLPSQARKSIYVVLFPQRAWNTAIVRAARRVIDLMGSDDSDPVVPLDGFHEVDASGCRWSRDLASLRVNPRAFRGGRARIRFGVPEGRSVEESLIDVRGSGIRWTVRGDDLVVERLDPDDQSPVELKMKCQTFVPAELGISNDLRQLGLRLLAKPGLRQGERLRSLTERAIGRIDGHDREIPASYDLLVAISEYTRTWVAKRWRQPSEVLAPPVDTETFRAPHPAEKRKVILSVGRFFHGSHNKKHLEMLKVFRTMVDRREVPEDWEYHLVGNLHRNLLEDLEYFAELKRLAEGYPVKLLIDLGLERLVKEYRRASIFWHAAGWGESEHRQPEKHEHFGLTTCEAMSSGCIPVVIAKAGQLEIVDHGENGFLFSTRRELSSITKRLVDGYGEPWTVKLMERASRSVERFARRQFEARLREILSKYDILDRRPDRVEDEPAQRDSSIAP